MFDALFDEGIKVYSGTEALAQVVEMEGVQMVLTALVGAAGLQPTKRYQSKQAHRSSK